MDLRIYIRLFGPFNGLIQNNKYFKFKIANKASLLNQLKLNVCFGNLSTI